MKTKLLALLIFNFSFLIYTCDGSAEIRFVSKTGSSVPPYTTWATASDSIQKCINICNDGDTVIVANGVYKETLAITKRIALIGSSMDSTVIDGAGLNGIYSTYLTIDVRADCSIENFHLIGKSISNSLLLRANNFMAVIKNCETENSELVFVLFERSSVISGVISHHFADRYAIIRCINDSARPVIENSIIYKSIDGGYNYIIYLDYGGNPVIRNNIISINLLPNAYSYGIYQNFMVNSLTIENNLIFGAKKEAVSTVRTIDTIRVINNIIKRSFKHDIGMWITYGNKTIIRNNVIADNDIGLYIEDGYANTDYNVYWNNTNNTYRYGRLGEHDIIADPMFVKDTIPFTGLADFHLQKYSPAIDAGDPAILDVDGSRSDIGIYGGPLGEKYDYKDLAPKAPKGLTGSLDSSYITIKWKKNTEADFNYYKIFRDTAASFTPDSSKLVSAQSDTSYSHIVPHKVNKYFYKLTAVDSQGNESPASEEIGIVITSVENKEVTIIQNYQLYQNYPNPFNPYTIIPFRLKERGYVKISLYDIKGELLGYLLNEVKEAGYHEVEFKTNNFLDGQLSSGIYLYRIEVIGAGGIPAFFDMKKMIFLK